MQIRSHPLSRPQVRESPGGATLLVGTAVVYHSWSDLLFNSFRERFVYGSLTKSLKSGTDVVATVDHDEKRLLGRTSSKTLRLNDTREGLIVEVTIPDITYARDLVELIRRGDIRGMSFIFEELSDGDEWGRGADGVPERTVVKANLFEVSFVIFPAYPSTDAGLRNHKRGN